MNEQQANDYATARKIIILSETEKGLSLPHGLDAPLISFIFIFKKLEG